MPHPIIATDSYIEIKVGGHRITRVNYSELGAGNDKKRAGVLRDRLQAGIDTRIPIADLPDGSDPLIGDEPTRTVNPNRPGFFWGDSQGKVQTNPARNDHLIARDTVVTDVVWDGTRYSITQLGLPGKKWNP